MKCKQCGIVGTCRHCGKVGAMKWCVSRVVDGKMVLGHECEKCAR